MLSTLTRLLPRNASKPRTVCQLPGGGGGVMPSCQNGSSCNWANALLNALLPPVNARQDPEALDALMEDLLREPIPQKTSLHSETVHPAADRIIALGDVHGDVNAMRGALRAAGVIDAKDAWTGGKTVLVQVGDQLDRGNKERDIYNLLFRLQDAAPSAGGAVHILLGNHELMNSRLDFRYVTTGGFADFARDGGVTRVFGKACKPRVSGERLRAIRQLPKGMRSRASSIVAGGPLAIELSQRARVAVIVGDTIFVHAGLTPRHVQREGNDGNVGDVNNEAIACLQELNNDTRKFMQGHGGYPRTLHGSGSPVWMRDYSRPGLRAGSAECRMLNETLKVIGVKRMVVGHTPQAEGINSACGGKVWRIDTGMSKVYGGVPEAIEISRRGNIKVYTMDGIVHGSARYK